MSEPSHPSRRFSALPTTKNQRNRFAVEPIETTSKSNRQKTALQSVGATKGSVGDERVPESVETTTKDDRHLRIIPGPTPITTENTHGKSMVGLTEWKIENNENKADTIRIESTTRRKFAPQLIETTRRSHRVGDARCSTERYRDDDGDDGPSLFSHGRTHTPTQRLEEVDGGPPLLPYERTQPPQQDPENSESPSHKRAQPPSCYVRDGTDGPPLLPHERARSPPKHPGRPRGMSRRRGLMPIPPANTRVPSSADMLQYPIPRRTTSTHPHDNTRKHSFAVPSLEPIISQPNSDESNCPSLSTSPSLSSESSSLADLWRYASGMRESCDDRFSGYLLALAARAAEKQLREQAMAAYVNDSYHEPVEHFANDRESDESDTDVLGLELVPQHENAGVDAMGHDLEDESHWEAEDMRAHQARTNHQRDEQKDHELGLGLTGKLSIKDEIVPPARLAVTDASGAPRSIIGGWQKGIGLGPMRDAASPPMLGSNLKFRLCHSPQQTTSDLEHSNKQNVSQGKNGGGLWMGLCSAKPKGEGTPSRALLGPGETSLTKSRALVVEERDISAEIDQEFNDEFVTQVYNYLSLGYPCLARKFDAELSQLSGVPLEEISSADQLADAKGYVGLGEGVGVAAAGVANGRCGRWKALRSYIREWAKRSPSMEQGGVGLDTWGARARKGSWAI